MDLEKEIEKHALNNAVKYNGRANPNAVLGQIMQEFPRTKKEVQKTKELVELVVERVNSMSAKDQRSLLKTHPKVKAKDQTRESVLPNVKGKVVMRLEPSPSGPLHIGHTYPLGWNHYFCKKYKGKLIIRISDTNPSNIYPAAYDMLAEDSDWFTQNGVGELVIQSDRMELYYAYAEKLLSMGKAYICTCSQEKFRKCLEKKQACACRDLSPEEHIERWEAMLSSMKPGDAVMRIKTDVKHANPAMRDWPAMRINTDPHPRQGTKFRVWPLMNFSVAVDDHELGVTHTIRGKDHMDNEKRVKYLYEHLGWEMPTHLYVGRVNFKGLDLSKSKTKKAVEEGKYTGWDDIRLPFLPALRKRGYQPEAMLKCALAMGLTQTDKTVEGADYFKSLDSFNRELLEESDRYFFVKDPVRITVENAPPQEVELNLHPDRKKGGRKLKTGADFFVCRDDYAEFKEGMLYRLMDCLNFFVKNKSFVFDSLDYEKYKKKGARIIHWLPAAENLAKVRVAMPDFTHAEGLGEPGMRELKKGSIIQAERFGFIRLVDENAEKLEFWFTHK